MEDQQLIVRCECGWETTGTTDEVVADTQAHGMAVHNMRASRDDVLAMSAPVDETG